MTIECAILVSGGRRDEVALVSGAAQGSRRTHLVLVSHNVVLNTSFRKLHASIGVLMSCDTTTEETLAHYSSDI